MRQSSNSRSAPSAVFDMTPNRHASLKHNSLMRKSPCVFILVFGAIMNRHRFHGGGTRASKASKRLGEPPPPRRQGERPNCSRRVGPTRGQRDNAGGVRKSLNARAVLPTPL